MRNVTDHYVELDKEIADKIKVSNLTIEAHYEVVYWVSNVEFDVDVEEVQLVGFLENGSPIDVGIIPDDLKQTLISLVDVNDSDFLLKLLDCYCCSFEY